MLYQCDNFGKKNFVDYQLTRKITRKKTVERLFQRKNLILQA
jgi:hypothetical protein